MADETTSSSIQEIIPSEVIQESRMAFQKDAGVLPLIRSASLTGKPGATAPFPHHNEATVTKPANETTDVTTKSEMTAAELSLTVARRTVRVDVSDLSRASAVEDVNELAGRKIGKARIKQVETDIGGVMTTNHSTFVGATDNTAITPEDILSAQLKLKNAEADDNMLLWLHSNQENHLLDDIVVTSSSDSDRSAVAQDAMVSGSLKNRKLFGFVVLPSQRVSTGTDTNDIYLGMAFNAQELAYLSKDIAPSLEFERDASAALTEVIMNYYDSAGQIRGAAFVLVKSQTYSA